jgi:small subunit ribosomal protein S5
MLNDKSRPTQEDLLADILYDDTKFFDENENDDGSLLSTSKLLKSKKEIQRLKKKAREDSIKYKDETPEERKLRIRAEAQEEEYIAACHAASRALVRPPGAPEPTDEMPGTWIETVVAVDRVQKIIKGGSIMSYRVLVVVGNAQGAGGFGIGKAADPGTATTRAIREAKKNIIVVDRYKNTALVHSVEGKHNSCRVVLRAVPPGWGTKGGKVVKTILEQMGISDCTGKAVGRRHPYAVVRATFKALARHTSVADISRSRGRRVLDVMWRSGKE